MAGMVAPREAGVATQILRMPRDAGPLQIGGTGANDLLAAANLACNQGRVLLRTHPMATSIPASTRPSMASVTERTTRTPPWRARNAGRATEMISRPIPVGMVTRSTPLGLPSN